MAKGYWLRAYRTIPDPTELAAYSKRTVPAVIGAGMRVVSRSMASKTYEAGASEPGKCRARQQLLAFAGTNPTVSPQATTALGWK
ncbi:hypothetical protein SAMN05414139_10095 [Burkholderia sp. D7]|nr:hypothetical protein SAMN05414139_10095 [Burkholderia sp. D7]